MVIIMSVERELLKNILATGWLNNTIYCREVEKLLAQPEPFKPDWDNYKQGVADSKREPLSDEAIADLWWNNYVGTADSVRNFARAIEKAHGIGVDNE